MKHQKSVTRAATSSPSAATQPERLGWLSRGMSWLLTSCGAIGLAASLGLSIEEFQHLKHPSSPLACDLNPVIGCGAGIDNWQGHVLFGIPNEFFGIAVFTAMAVIGIAMLAGATFKRWLWQSLQLGLAGGVLFVLWFIYQSLYVLHHLCPFCMTTWVVTLISFWYVLLYNIREGNITLRGRLERLGSFAQRYHADIIAFVFLVISGVILQHFWYYFGSLF